MGVIPDHIIPGGVPSGTVTFVFTDIEGSTARWDRHASAMASALRRHDDLLRAAIVRTTGSGSRSRPTRWFTASGSPR